MTEIQNHKQLTFDLIQYSIVNSGLSGLGYPAVISLNCSILIQLPSRRHAARFLDN